MPAATTAAHAVRLFAAPAQRHVPAKRRRKQPRPEKNAQHEARVLRIAQAVTGPSTIVRMATAPIQIVHGPTVPLATAQTVIAPSRIAHVVTDRLANLARQAHRVHRDRALTNAETSVLASVMTTVGVMTAATHQANAQDTKVARNGEMHEVVTADRAVAQREIKTEALAVAAISADTPMTAMPRKHRAHPLSRKSAAMMTARCVCPS